MQVYSDQPYYNIEKTGVVIMTPASEGLGRYYEYVLKSMHVEEMKGPTDQELSEIEMEEDINDDDDFLEYWDEEDKVYH